MTPVPRDVAAFPPHVRVPCPTPHHAVTAKTGSQGLMIPLVPKIRMQKVTVGQCRPGKGREALPYGRHHGRPKENAGNSRLDAHRCL